MTIKVYRLAIPDNREGETLTLAQVTGILRGLAPNIPVTADAAYELGIPELLGDVIGEVDPTKGQQVDGETAKEEVEKTTEEESE